MESIELSFDHVTVEPMPNLAFSYHIGNVNIDYRPHNASFLKVPPSGPGDGGVAGVRCLHCNNSNGSLWGLGSIQ